MKGKCTRKCVKKCRRNSNLNKSRKNKQLCVCVACLKCVFFYITELITSSYTHIKEIIIVEIDILYLDDFPIYVCSRCVNIYLYMQIYDVYVNLCEWTLKWIFNSRQYDALCVYERKRVCMYLYVYTRIYVNKGRKYVCWNGVTDTPNFFCLYNISYNPHFIIYQCVCTLKCALCYVHTYTFWKNIYVAFVDLVASKPCFVKHAHAEQLHLSFVSHLCTFYAAYVCIYVPCFLFVCYDDDYYYVASLFHFSSIFDQQRIRTDVHIQLNWINQK